MTTDHIHVAAALIVNPRAEVLISLRPAHAHQGGLWEFPGGKVDADEDAFAALARELDEELGIAIRSARPLIRIPYCYPDRKVLLDVWRVSSFAGTPYGREGQRIAWVAPAKLDASVFPAANGPIVTAARLPDRYLITPEPGEDFLARLEHALTAGIRLVQLRAKGLGPNDYAALARAVCTRVHAAGAQVLLNAPPDLAIEVGADGVHLTTQRLMALSQRPLPTAMWVAASCHTVDELQQALRVGCDFAVLGPVQPTRSHPSAPHLGWDGLQALTEQAPLPVYALGGLDSRHLAEAWAAGAQGIAAIRGLWPEDL